MVYFITASLILKGSVSLSQLPLVSLKGSNITKPSPSRHNTTKDSDGYLHLERNWMGRIENVGLMSGFPVSKAQLQTFIFHANAQVQEGNVNHLLSSSLKMTSVTCKFTHGLNPTAVSECCIAEDRAKSPAVQWLVLSGSRWLCVTHCFLKFFFPPISFYQARKQWHPRNLSAGVPVLHLLSYQHQCAGFQLAVSKERTYTVTTKALEPMWRILPKQ